MSIVPVDITISNSEKKNRKHLCLSIAQKVEVLQKLDCGVSVRRLTKEYGVGTTTIYDLKKQKDKLLKFYAESDEQRLMKNRKTLHKAKNKDLDRVLKEWIRQRQNENMPLNGMLIMKQARIYHDELKIETNCEYSAGWLQKFKKRHGIRFLKRGGGAKASADQETAEKFIDEFAKIIMEGNLQPEQIYNADETSLFWRYCPKKTITDERNSMGIIDSKDKITVLGCANAAGTHKCKLAVIGKSMHPRCLEGANTLPVHYYSNKGACITKDIFFDWFHKHFVPAARTHCSEAGLDSGCKIFLFLDNCFAHSPAELLASNDVYAIYFPPNVTSLIQPCEQGILRSIKNKYKECFLKGMLAAVNRGMDIEGFQKDFTIKNAIYTVANAWNGIEKSVLVHAWYNLWPMTTSDDYEVNDEYDGSHMTSEKQMVSDILIYAKGISSDIINKLDKTDIEEVLNIDNETPVIHSMTDGEIAEMVLNHDPDGNSDEDNDSDTASTEKVPVDHLVKMCDGLIEGLKQYSFMTEQDIMSIYAIKAKLLDQSHC